MKVLVVDDTFENVYMLEALLKGNGYEVLSATNGIEALDKLKQEPISLIISDIMMPKMDGFQLCRAVMTDETLKTIPFVFYTATYTAEQDRDFAIGLGASRFILKPTDPGEFMTIIREVLSEHTTGQIKTGDRRIVDETEYLKEHQSRLILKLGDKITELERSKEELTRSEMRFRNLFQQFHGLLDALPDCLMLLDRNLKILWANKSTAVNFNSTPEQLTGRFCYELWYGRTSACEECPVLESFATGKPQNQTITRPDERIWNIRTVPLPDQNGEITSVIEVKRDVTEHRKLEAQYLHAQKMDSIGTLAGGIAHDFNNILSAIIGYGHVALMDMSDEDPQRFNVEGILEAADRAALLTKDLLLFSRKQVSERKAIDLNKVVVQMEKFIKRLIGEDIECITTLWHDPLTVLVDSHQLEQVLMNLATNARDAMPGGGSFALRTDKVGQYALLTVSDTGTGIDDETQKHIFEPFFTTKEIGKGTGLGLAVVYGIINEHGGTITVNSEPGKGTAFSITLPLTEAVSSEETAARGLEHPIYGTETILLAEDDDALRKLTLTVLMEYGYTIIEAVDGEDAVKKFSENAEKTDLLLFDLIMPKMNGKDAVDAIRRNRPDMKAIFISGYTPDILRQKSSLDAGAALVYKPVAPMDLLKKVRNMLDGETS